MPTDYDKYRKEIEAIAGTRPSAPEPVIPPAPVEPERPVAKVGLERNITKDVMTSLVKGGIGTAQAAVGLVDLIPGIKLGKSLDKAGFSFADMQERMSQDYSPAQQAAFKQWEEARGIRESVGSLLSNPSVAAHAAIESLPLSLFGGGVIGRGVMKAAPTITRGMAAALGEGAVTAGALNENIRNETPEKETSLGQKAMAVGGGAITSLISGAGARFAAKRGLANIDEIGMAPEKALNKTLEKIGSKIKNPGVIKRIIEGGGTEFFEELTQEGQEQVWQNAALGKPLLDDVPKSMLLGGAAGGLTGGVYNIRPDEVKTHVPTPTKGDRDAFIAASVSQNMPGDSIKLLRASPQARAEWGLSEADIDYIEQLKSHPTIQQAYATINSAPTESAKQGMQAYLFNWVKQQQGDLGVKKPEAEVQATETEELKSIGHKAKPAEKLSIKALEKRLGKLEKKREELMELKKLDPENTSTASQLNAVARLKHITEVTLGKKTKEKKHADIDIKTQDLASLTFERQKLEASESLTKEEKKRLTVVRKEIDERMEEIRQLAQDSSEESRAKDRKSKVLASVPVNDRIEGDKTAARAGVMFTDMSDDELNKNIADTTETINVLSKVATTTPEERGILKDAKAKLKEFTHTKKQREADAAAALAKEKEQEKSTIGKAAPEVRSKLKSLGYSDKDIDGMPVETAQNAAALNILVKKLEPAIDGTRPMATPKRDKKGRSYSEKPLPAQSARIFEAIKTGVVVKDWDEKQSVSFGDETLKVTPAHIRALKARGLVDTEQDTKNLIPLDPTAKTTDIAKNELVKVASEIGPIKHETVEGFHRSTDPERLQKGIEPSEDTFRIVRDPASLTTAQEQADEMAAKFKAEAPATKETSGQQQDYNVTFEGTVVDYNNPKTKRFIDKLLVNLANEGSGLPVEHAVYEQLRKYGIDAVDNFNGIRGGTELHILNTKGLKVGKPFVAPKVKKVTKAAKAPKVELSPEDQLKANVARTAGTIKAFQTNISLLEEDYADMPADKKAGPKGKEIQAKIENIKKAIAGLEAQNTQATNTLKLAGKTEPKKAEPKKAEPKKAEPAVKTESKSLNVLQAQLATLKATRAEYRKKLATGPEDAKEIKAKVETLNEKINATLAAINRASTTPDVKTKKSKTAKAKAKAKAAAKPVAPTTPKKDLDTADIQAKINKIKGQIAAAKAKFEDTDKLAHQLKLLKESLESKLAESKEAPPKKPVAPKKPTPKKKDEALRKVNLANPTMSTAQQRAVKYLASGKTIKMAEGKKVHPSSETGLSTLKALEKKGVVKRAIDGTYSLADVFTSEGEIQRSVQEIDSDGYITAHDAERAVKGWTAHWRYTGNIHVVKDVSQLPGNVAKSLSVKSRKTRGCYIDKTGDIFIISDNNPTYKKLFENLMHEAFGHHGIRMMPANLINPFLDQIWKDKQDTDRMRFINKHYAHVAKAKTAEERVLAQRRSAEEWIANEATVAEEATWKDRLIALIQRWLRSMGINFKVTDAEIKTWLSNMRQAVVRGDERLWTKHGIEMQLSEEESTWAALTKQPKTAQEAQTAQEADLKQINNIIATKFKDPVVKKIANLFGRIFKALPENIDQPVRDANTQTTNFFTRLLSSPEFYFTRSSAAAKVMAHAINQTQLKFETLHGLTGESLNTIEQISQTDPESYDKGGEYLRSVDKSGVGYGLMFKGKKWHVLTPKRNIIYSFESEKLAVAKMVEEEGKHVKSLGYSDNVVKMVKEWRQFTNRCFDAQVAEMRKQIKRSKDNDLPEPTVVFTNEKGQEREVIPMSVAIALMGDRRGTYFPRERPSRQYVLIADAGGPLGKKELIPISAYLPPNTLNGPVKTWLKQAINSALPVSKEVQKLKDKGFTDDQISIRLVNRPSESTFDAPGSVTAIDTILKLAEEKVLNDDNITQTEVDLLNAMSQRISLAVGDIYKQKGALKSRVARAAEHWEGYESDPLKAASAYAQRLAAGIARRTTTRNMLEAFTGRDVSFKEYQKEHPNAQYKEYRQYVRDKAVHPVKQRQLYDDLRTYMTHVARPDTKVDRFVGYLKGLAVLKFLGLRVSSAAINLTGLMTAGPATLSTHANISLLQATKFIAEAIPKYLSYRAHVMQKKGLLSSAMKAMFKPGKLTAEDIAIFDEITAKGLDEAQFNRETMRQLQSKAGDFWNSLMSFAMMFFGATERLNRAVTIHAAQRALKMKDPNLTQQSLLDKSIFISNRTHGIYGKEAKPWLVQKVPFLDLPYTFFKYQQTYLLNAWEQGVTFGNVKNAMFMLLAPAVLAGAGTSVFTPAASAVASVIMRSFRIKGADDPEEALYEWAEKTLGSDAFFRNGFAGLANINLKGSLQINAPLPDLSDGYVGLMGAPGAVFTDIIKGFVETEKYGWVKGMESFMPTAISSIMKGHREYTEGVSGKDYSPIFFGEGRLKGTAMDFAMRSIAFNPAHISGRREKQWRENQVRLNYQKDRSLVLDRLKKLLTQGPENATAEGYAELYKTIDEYNNKAAMADPKYYVPMITSKWLNTQIKRIASPNKYERLREI